MDYFGYICAFGLGFWVCKKKNKILCFLNSLKYLYQKSDPKVYNDFFECDFSNKDYVKEVDSFDE